MSGRKLIPVDRVAARVISRGEHFTPDVKMRTRHWAEAPPATFPPPRGYSDLTGRKVGRTTVVGFLRRNNRTGRCYWLVRCSCGSYEERRAEKILKAADGVRCEKCMHLINIKRRDAWLSGGKQHSSKTYLLD